MNRADKKRYMRAWKHLERGRLAMIQQVIRLNPRHHKQARQLQDAMFKVLSAQLAIEQVWRELGYTWPASIDNLLGIRPTTDRQN